MRGLRLLAIELSFAWQAVWGRPWWSAGIVINLALLLGLTTGLFSLYMGAAQGGLDAVSPDRLVSVAAPAPGSDPTRVPARVFQALQARARSFTALGAARPVYAVTADTPGDPIDLLAVTPGWLQAVQPAFARGGGFGAAEHEGRPAGEVIPAVISYRVWQGRFEGREDVLGLQIPLADGRRLSVKGVLSQRFIAPLPTGAAAHLLMPLPTSSAATASQGVMVVGRLRDGTSHRTARDEVVAVLAELRRAGTSVPASMEVEVARYPEQHARHARVLAGALGWATLLLLVGVTTAAMQFLGRWLARRREHAVRMAIGASPGRVARHALLESELLAMLALGPGLALAGGLLAGFQSIYVDARWTNPGFRDAGLNLTALAFALGCALLLGAIVGAPAALVVGRPRVHAVLKESSRSHSGGRAARWWRETVLAGQMGIVMLMGVHVLVWTNQLRWAQELRKSKPPVHVSLGSLDAGNAAVLEAARSLRTGLHGRPDVQASAIIKPPPSAHDARAHQVRLHGPPGHQRAGAAIMRAVEGDVVGTLGVALVAGRWFRAGESTVGPTPVVVDREFVLQLLYDSPALGQVFSVEPLDPRLPQSFVIIGVVSVFSTWTYDRVPPIVYFPPFGEGLASTPSLLVRLRLEDGVDPVARVQAAVRGQAPPEVFLAAEPFTVLAGPDLIPVMSRLFILLLVTMAASLLSTITLVEIGRALIATRRTEIAIRIAVGATPLRVMLLLLKTGWIPVTAGTALGTALGLLTAADWGWTPRTLGFLAFSVPTTPLMLYLFLLWPAWRASRVPVLETLRHE
jgi:hypothetical protein